MKGHRREKRDKEKTIFDTKPRSQSFESLQMRMLEFNLEIKQVSLTHPTPQTGNAKGKKKKKVTHKKSSSSHLGLTQSIQLPNENTEVPGKGKIQQAAQGCSMASLLLYPIQEACAIGFLIKKKKKRVEGKKSTFETTKVIIKEDTSN